MKVLLIDENPADRAMVIEALGAAFPKAQYVEVSRREALDDAMTHATFDLIIMDDRLHWADALQVVHAVRARWANTPVVMLTHTDSARMAAAGMKAGLSDYVLKGDRHHLLQAAQQSLAPRRLQAERRGDEEARFLQAQLEVAQAALSSLQPDVLLPRLLSVICRTQNYQLGLLLRLMEDGQTLEIAASCGENTEVFLGCRRGVQDSVSPAAEALRMGKPIYVNNLVSSQRIKNPQMRFLQVQSVMALPLFTRTGEIIGVLNLGDTENPNRFTAQNVEQGIVLAHQVSQAVENSALFGQLQRLQEQYRTVTDTLHDAVYTLDLEGRVTFANPALTRLTGYCFEELLGQPSLMMHAPECIPVILERREAAGRGEEIAPYVQTKLLHKDGGRIDVEVSATMLFQDGQITGRVVVARDISARLQLEGEVRQSQKMQALGAFAGGIAHDFNNILGVVLGYAELTELVLDHPSERHAARENLRQIRVAGERARDIVRQILTFSRQTDQQRQPLQLRLLIKETLTLLRAALPTTITLLPKFDTCDDIVLADPTQMHQVLLNLCANAEYAMRDTGGMLEIGLEAIDLPSGAAPPHPDLIPGAYVCLRVRDTGQGIEPAALERLFDPFYTTKSVGEGTGLGLAVAHGVVAEHGGFITVESAPGQGATFRIYLPRSDRAQASIAPTREVLPRGRERILFVDDEAHLAQLGQAVLTRLGYDVASYTSSVAALAAFGAAPHDFQLVITDQTMPELTGETLVRELRHLRSDIPIILCTGFSHAMNEEKAKLLGIDAFYMKPILSHDLAQLIRRVLEQRATRVI